MIRHIETVLIKDLSNYGTQKIIIRFKVQLILFLVLFVSFFENKLDYQDLLLQALVEISDIPS